MQVDFLRSRLEALQQQVLLAAIHFGERPDKTAVLDHHNGLGESQDRSMFSVSSWNLTTSSPSDFVILIGFLVPTRLFSFVEVINVGRAKLSQVCVVANSVFSTCSI